LLAVRLSDVAPGGAATRVTYGLLNLSFRDGFAAGRPMVPGERCRVAVRLNDIAHRFAAGHRLRLAVSTGYWPLAWPSPEPVRLTLFAGAGTLRLPVRPAHPGDAALAAFAAPEAAEPIAHVRQSAYRRARQVRQDVATGEITVEAVKDRGRFLLQDSGVTYAGIGVDRFTIRQGQPSSARVESTYSIELSGTGWATRTEARTVVTATPTEFLVLATLEAYEAEARIFVRSWDAAIPRRNF